MLSVEAVKELNSRIEKIESERTSSVAEYNLLVKQLKQGIQEYGKKYGVDLSGKSFDKVCDNIKKEAEKVSSDLEEEVVLKQKVAEAIESGDIKLANKLLGVTAETKQFIGAISPEEVVSEEVPAVQEAPKKVRKEEKPANEELEFDFTSLNDSPEEAAPAEEKDDNVPEKEEKPADNSFGSGFDLGFGFLKDTKWEG